jgi:transcriptional regulator with XRE-family HTH domain
MIKKQLGKRVRELRTHAHLSQEKFALLIGMDRTYLASVESGKRNISIENIDKIAKGFGMTLEKFFEGL